MITLRLPRHALAIAGLAAVLLLSGCAGGPSTVASTAPPYVTPTYAPGQKLSSAAALALLRQLYSRLTTAHLDVTSSGTGSGASTLNGDVDFRSTPAAVSGQLLLALMPTQTPIKLIFAGGNLYLNIADMTGSQYVETSFSQISAVPGVDLIDAIDPKAALTQFSAAISGVTYVGNEAIDGVQADHYTVSLDSAAALKADTSLFRGAPPDVVKQFTKVTTRPYEDIWVDGQGNLVQVITTLDGVTTTVNLSSFGEPVSITAPPASQVTSADQLGLAPGA